MPAQGRGLPGPGRARSRTARSSRGCWCTYVVHSDSTAGGPRPTVKTTTKSGKMNCLVRCSANECVAPPPFPLHPLSYTRPSLLRGVVIRIRRSLTHLCTSHTSSWCLGTPWMTLLLCSMSRRMAVSRVILVDDDGLPYTHSRSSDRPSSGSCAKPRWSLLATWVHQSWSSAAPNHATQARRVINVTALGEIN